MLLHVLTSYEWPKWFHAIYDFIPAQSLILIITVKPKRTLVLSYFNLCGIVLNCVLLIRFLLDGTELLSFCLVPNNMVQGWTCGLQRVYSLSFFYADLFYR